MIVTSDQKDDWFRKVGSRVVGPRIELIEEMENIARVYAHVYTLGSFVKYARTYLALRISEEVEQEVNRLPTLRPLPLGRERPPIHRFRQVDNPEVLDWPALAQWLRTGPSTGYPYRIGESELADLASFLNSPDDLELARVLLNVLRADLAEVEAKAAAIRPAADPAHYRRSSTLTTRIAQVEAAIAARGG